MTKPFHILISSSGRRGALVGLCRRALASLGLEGKVLAADITKTSAAYQLCDDGFYATRFDDPTYIPEMLKVCEEQSVGLVIPTHDRELMLYAETVNQFEAIGTHVVVPSPEVVTLGSDKLAIHHWLSERGFPVPKQTTAETMLAGRSDLTLPALIKPQFGSSSIGVHIIDDLIELAQLSQKQPYLVQSIAQGNEYTVDLFVDQSGVCRCAVPRRRLETRSGEISKGITERNETVIQLATDVCNELPQPRGVMCLQLFHDPANDECKIIELNTRFGGGYPLTHEAGADYISWLIEEAMGMPSSANNTDWQDELVMLRYDDAVFVPREQAGL